MTRPAPKFGIRQSDGQWVACDPKLNARLRRALEDFAAGTPGSILVRDDHDETHVLTWKAGMAVYLALMAMDARLRPGGCYREKADEIYAVLAGVYHADAIQELRRVFRLGAKKPWLVPDGDEPPAGPPTGSAA